MADGSVLNYSKKSNYMLLIPDDNIKISEYYIRSFNIPNISIGSNMVYPIAQPYEVPNNIITFEPLNLDIILDEDLDIKQIFDNQILTYTKNPETGMFYFESRMMDIDLVLLSNKGNPTNKRVRFYDAWFDNSGVVNFEIQDDSTHTMNVTAKYKYYKWITV